MTKKRENLYIFSKLLFNSVFHWRHPRWWRCGKYFAVFYFCLRAQFRVFFGGKWGFTRTISWLKWERWDRHVGILLSWILLQLVIVCIKFIQIFLVIQISTLMRKFLFCCARILWYLLLCFIKGEQLWSSL